MFECGQIFAVDMVLPLFNAFFQEDLRIGKCCLTKLETSFYGMVYKAYFDILNRLGVTYECDRQADG